MAIDISALQREVTAARERHAAAVAGVHGAQARAAAARDELRAEFGVETLEEALELQRTLERELEDEAGQVAARLEGSR